MVHYATNIGSVQTPELIKNVVVIGTTKAYEKSFDEFLPKILESAAVSLSSVSLFNALWKDLKEGQSTEHWMPRGDSDADNSPLLRFVLGKLPAKVSRHNAPGQPHNVTTLLKGLCSTALASPALVVLLCEDPAHAPSMGYAVARVATSCSSHNIGSAKPDGYYNYSRKTGAGGISAAVSSDAATTSADIQAPPSLQVIFSHEISSNEASELETVGRNILLTRRLVDSPCNELHTTAFVKEALLAVKDLPNVTAEVIEGEELNALGFGGLYGVGKAAVNPPALVILRHFSSEASKDKPSIVLVGKGIVYDTGGLSIKTKTGMPGMKRDMGGAAAILGAFCSIVEQQEHPDSTASPRPVHAVLCLAENAVGPTATRPDDVHTMLSGRTVEINNTDAEGRLVLADGVVAAIQRLNPGTIVDMATLTGAQGVATGRFFASIYCNDEGLENDALQAGRSCGDLVHPVPYAPEFFIPEFKSAVADMKNSVADRANAQVSCAGQFIGNHMQNYLTAHDEDTSEHKKNTWLHVDMAYPSFDKRDERATGYGVALLFELAKKLI